MYNNVLWIRTRTAKRGGGNWAAQQILLVDEDDVLLLLLHVFYRSLVLSLLPIITN